MPYTLCPHYRVYPHCKLKLHIHNYTQHQSQYIGHILSLIQDQPRSLNTNENAQALDSACVSHNTSPLLDEHDLSFDNEHDDNNNASLDNDNEFVPIKCPSESDNMTDELNNHLQALPQSTTESSQPIIVICQALEEHLTAAETSSLELNSLVITDSLSQHAH